MAALVTIMQYWAERQDRRASHLSATLTTYLDCQELVRFSLTQETDVAHRFLTFIVDYNEAVALCDSTRIELERLMRQARSAELADLPKVEEAREILRWALPQNTGSDIDF